MKQVFKINVLVLLAFVNDCVVYASRFNLNSIKKVMKFNLKAKTILIMIINRYKNMCGNKAFYP